MWNSSSPIRMFRGAPDHPMAQQQQQQAGPQTFGPNTRYVPPTFNWGGNGDMQWNQMRDYYVPASSNDPYTSRYMQQFRDMLSGYNRPFVADGDRDTSGSSDRSNIFGRQASMGEKPSWAGNSGGGGSVDPRMLMQMLLGGMNQRQMFGGFRPLDNRPPVDYGAMYGPSQQQQQQVMGPIAPIQQQAQPSAMGPVAPTQSRASGYGMPVLPAFRTTPYY